MMWNAISFVMLILVGSARADESLPLIELGKSPLNDEVVVFGDCIADSSRHTAIELQDLVTMARDCLPDRVTRLAGEVRSSTAKAYSSVATLPLSEDSKVQVHLEIAYAELHNIISHERNKDPHDSAKPIAAVELVDSMSQKIAEPLRDQVWPAVSRRFAEAGICNPKSMGMMIIQAALFYQAGVDLTLDDLFAYHRRKAHCTILTHCEHF